MNRRILFALGGLVRSMVPQDQNDSPDVLRFSLGTSVLRIWALQPIGRKDRECESLSVKRTAPCVVNATRASGNGEIFAIGRSALQWR
jgi:hypothetical protein